MVSWWYSLSLHAIGFILLVMLFVNLCHHWAVLLSKWSIFRRTQAFHKEEIATRQAHEETLAGVQAVLSKVNEAIVKISEAVMVVKGWAELARIQTSESRSVVSTIKEQAKKTEELTTKLEEHVVPVVDKLAIVSDSGILKTINQGEKQ